MKLVILKFLTCYYFREILKSRDFINAFVIFAKYINFHKMAKFKYFAKQMAYSTSPGRMPLLSLVSIARQMPRPRHKNKAIIRLSSHPSHQSLCFDSKLVVIVVVIGLMETRL